MTDLLVGSTGFVGTNLADSHSFGLAVHSSNIKQSFGRQWDLAIYAGIPSAMFLANNEPEADLEIMRNARLNIQRINPKRLVLISTISVYPDSRGKSELDAPEPDNPSAYGANRRQLEQWVREDFPDALVVRLPALYGIGLKKNFLYDLKNPAPVMLKEGKFHELAKECPLILESYAESQGGYFRQTQNADTNALNRWFGQHDFNSLCFTDSRSRFQFYSLGNLWEDIKHALEAEVNVLNIATAPLQAGEIYRHLHGTEWRNELDAEPFDYDMKTVHFGNTLEAPGYRQSKESTLEDVIEFVRNSAA